MIPTQKIMTRIMQLTFSISHNRDHCRYLSSSSTSTPTYLNSARIHNTLKLKQQLERDYTYLKRKPPPTTIVSFAYNKNEGMPSLKLIECKSTQELRTFSKTLKQQEWFARLAYELILSFY